MSTFDAIVLGTGGVGSAAAFHLARRGCRVLGLDRFPGGHDRGSSHGQTRIIRMAYFEHPNYVPLLRRAYELWRELEQRSGQRLYFETGLIEIGPADGVVVPGVLASAERHQLPIERLDLKQAGIRFPGFRCPDQWSAVFERQAGYLLVEPCVLAHLAEASKLDVELRTGVNVLNWSASPGGIEVQTDCGSFRAKTLIVTAGAWAKGLLSDLGIPLTVRRKHLHWFRTADKIYRADKGCPCFFYETREGFFFYGFPELDELGVKVAEHSGGTVIADPLKDDRSVERVDQVRVEEFLAEFLPGVTHTTTHHTVCYYTMSPDEHFIVDRHPHHSNVCFAAGLSGHGFKFTSVLGEILADLAVNDRTAHPIEFLGCGRPSLTVI